jgi:predicted branched-subunit amino acid permease
MASTTPISHFLRGGRDSLPFVLVAGPFGLLFGVLAAEAGLALHEVMAFSIAVFAGAAQFTALQLMQEHTPTIIVIISALAVNLRVAMYSASLTPYLGGAPFWQRVLAAYLTVDQAYALSIMRFERPPEMTLPERMAYFFGTNLIVAPLWLTASFVGAYAGALIPDSWALDFALPIAFIAMVGPMMRTPAHVIAAFVGASVALLAAGIPYNLGLIVAGLAGMIAGAQAEVMLDRRREPLT